MDKTTQDLHQDEIRDSGISLNGDSSLISQEPAVKIKGGEGGRQEWEYVEKRPWIVVVWVSVGEQANQERVSNGRIVCDYGIKINGGYYVGTGEVRNDGGERLSKESMKNC